MKKTILTKMMLLLVVVAFSTASMAQTDSLASLFYQNVQTSNNVLRFENDALASVRFTSGSLTDNFQYYLKDENGLIVSPKQTNNAWNEVLFENLHLDTDYSIHTSFQGQEYLVGYFHTRDNSLEPFEASETLFNALEDWYEIPQATRPEAGEYLIAQPSIPFFESIAYLQALYDMPHLPNSLLEENSVSNIIDIWVDYGDPNDSIPTPPDLGDEVYEATLNFKPLDPATIDKCICQYTLKTRPTKDAKTSYIDKDYNYYITQKPRRYFQLGNWFPNSNTNTYEYIENGFAGPAKHVEYELNGYRTGQTISGDDGFLSSDPSLTTADHYAGIEMLLFCEGLPQKILNRLVLVYPSDEEPDFDFLTPTPAEECLCSKKVDLCWRYDAEIFVEAKENSCGGLRDNKGALTVQDYIEVTLQQGSGSTELLRSNNASILAKCNANRLEKTVKQTELIAKNAEIIAKNAEIAAVQTELDSERAKSPQDPVKIAELEAKLATKLAELQAKQSELLGKIKEVDDVEIDCSSSTSRNNLTEECRQITLKSNETTIFRMNNGYKITAEGKNCFVARADIKSDFYLTAIMQQPNLTPNDINYCCSKKWGRYFLGSFAGAPLSLVQAKQEVGSRFDFAGSWDAPYNNLSTNPTMVYDMDVLIGGQNCDDVIFNNTRVEQKRNTYFNDVDARIIGLDKIAISQIPTTEEQTVNTQVVITDMTGKVIANTNTFNSQITIENLPLRKGVYFVSLIAGNNFKTFKILNYE